jgi:Trypsin-like peptidase domain
MSDIRYGGSGGTHEWTAIAFPSPPIHASSLAVTPIEVLDLNGNRFCHGTGFAYRRDESVYLVTAWHVVSGRNFFDGKLNSNGLIPNQLKIYIPSFSQSDETLTVSSNPFELKLSEKAVAALTKPPEPFGFPVDVAVAKLPIETTKSGSFTSAGMNDFKWGIGERLGTPIQSTVGADIFVLGYPLSTYEELRTPIWKRGSLATEPSLKVTPEGSFLVDVNSAQGMSGGPIIRRVTTFTADNKDNGYIQEFYDEMVLGIYSGRALAQKETSFVLGYGWPIDLVHKIIDEKLCFSGF